MNLRSSGITMSVYAVVGPNCASLPRQKVTPERFSGRTSRPGVPFRERPRVIAGTGTRTRWGFNRAKGVGKRCVNLMFRLSRAGG
jgi:hypothetical protein